VPFWWILAMYQACTILVHWIDTHWSFPSVLSFRNLFWSWSKCTSRGRLGSLCTVLIMQYAWTDPAFNLEPTSQIHLFPSQNFIVASHHTWVRNLLPSSSIYPGLYISPPYLVHSILRQTVVYIYIYPEPCIEVCKNQQSLSSHLVSDIEYT
jgi:hypothetical protein